MFACVWNQYEEHYWDFDLDFVSTFKKLRK